MMRWVSFIMSEALEYQLFKYFIVIHHNMCTCEIQCVTSWHLLCILPREFILKHLSHIRFRLTTTWSYRPSTLIVTLVADNYYSIMVEFSHYAWKFCRSPSLDHSLFLMVTLYKTHCMSNKVYSFRVWVYPSLEWLL